MKRYVSAPAAMICALMAVFMLACSAPSLAADDSPGLRTAVGSAKADAAALMQQGKYASAYEMYMRLLRQAPDDDEINLNLARSSMHSGRYNQSVMAYERLTEKYPAEPVLYMELAQAYMALEDRQSAERAMATARELNPNISKADNDRLLDSLEKRYEHWQVHGKLRSGLLYDSNATFGPSSTTMNLGTWQVTVPDSEAKNSFGAYLGANLDMGWKAERDTPWWIVGDVQGLARGNSNPSLDDVHSRTSEWGRAAIGVRHLTPTTMFDLRVKSEVFDYQWYQNVSASGTEATWLWAVTPSWHLITRGTLDARAYSRDGDRNGAYWTLGQYVRRYFGESNHEIMLGVSYLGGNTPEKADYCYTGLEASARVVLKLPKRFELSPFVSFEKDWYNGPATALETSNRLDQKWRTGATLTWHVTDAWSVETSYQYTHNSSESPLYRYDQSLVSLGVAWSF
jgi:tetratricopeptide (TPR) repeat protein